MSFLQDNLACLQDREPDLFRLLSEASSDPDFESETAETGEPVVRFQGRYIHSRRNPRQEAKRLAAHLDHANCFVVLGFGLGYHVESILARHPHSDVIVIIKELSRLKVALENRALCRLLLDARVRVVVGPEPGVIGTLLKPYEHMALAVVPLVSLVREDPYFQQAKKAIDSFLERRTINLNTLRRFGRRWVRNLIANLPMIGHSVGIRETAGKFHGIPALVLAAGPSLDSVIPYLPSLAQSCLLIAVDTALPKLVEVGVEPDMAVIVDPQYWNSRHLDRMGFDRTLLVSESSTHPRVFRAFRTRPLLSSSLFPLGTYVESYLGSFGQLGAGGSVTTTAWDLARLLGCDPILLAGMDLGFPEGRTHCRGSFFEERAHTLSQRLLPAEQRAFAYLRDGGPFTVPANSGTNVITDRRMQLYRWWFENQAQLHSESTTYNLSEGGVALEGMPYRAVTDFLDLPDRRKAIERLTSPLKEDCFFAPAIPAALARGLHSLLRELESIEADLRRAVAILSQKAPGAALSSSHETEMAAIEHRLIQNPSREVVAFLALDEAHAVVALGENPEEPTEAERRALLLYRGLLESVEYHRRTLRNAAKVFPPEGREE